MEGTLKYSHSDGIQCLATNPVTGTLLSCTSSDFGIWSPHVKAVSKIKVPPTHKVNNRITSCAWTLDGQIFALGMHNGGVSLRRSDGDEVFVIERDAPVWALSWSVDDMLSVTDWDGRMAVYDTTGAAIGAERGIKFDACTATRVRDFVLIGGSDSTVGMYTPEGVAIGTLAKTNGWVWGVSAHPAGTHVAIASNDGTLCVMQLSYDNVYAFYGDRFAYRDNMTDVVITHLTTGQKAKIKCRDQVLKISVYKYRLAVQLPERCIVYELFHDENGDMHYRIKEKIVKPNECTLFEVTALHLITAHENRVMIYNYTGEKEREWTLDANVRVMKLIGGPRGKEGVLVGTADGSVLKIFIDSPFHIPLLKTSSPVLQLDLNLTRKKVAVVCESRVLSVYDLRSQEVEFTEQNAENVAWNAELEDMLCFSYGNSVSIKVSDFPCVQQTAVGQVLGVRGSRVYLFDSATCDLNELEVHLGTFIDRYVENGAYDKAYRLASLGIPESDWKKLGADALEHLNIGVARKAFTRIQGFSMLEGIRHIEAPPTDADQFLAEVHTISGNYTEVIST
jgi:intraflagellar transport protein 122